MKRLNSRLSRLVLYGCAVALSATVFFAHPSATQDRRDFWVGVGTAGINSHQPGRPWCPDGYYLVALDLDGPRNYSPYDTPVVGQALCRSGGGGRWTGVQWVGVENSGINSHQPQGPWCPAGKFLIALDLDSRTSYSAHDSPVVGQAMCAGIAGRRQKEWGACFWVGVQSAGINSHQPGKAWCPAGTFLVALDLDGPRSYSAYDSPVVGQAMCCSAR